MPQPQIVPYGSWESPITSDLIVSDSVGLGQIALDGEDVYWSESRPSEGGRNVIVRCKADGTIADMLHGPYDARSRVHEYGGGAYFVHGGTIYFSNYVDQRLYSLMGEREPQPITPDGEYRYADGVVDTHRGRIVCVREDHTVEGREAVNSIVSLSLDGSGEAQVLVSGNDFYAQPRLSPDGLLMAWVTWTHPNMPWGDTELWTARVNDDGSLGAAKKVAGGPREAAIQPEWSPDGVLYFISDPDGWWNIYRWRDGHVEPVVTMEAEFGYPMWQFGGSAYCFESSERIICRYLHNGVAHLASIDLVKGVINEIEINYTSVYQVMCKPGFAIMTVASPSEPTSLVQLELASGNVEVFRMASNQQLDSGYVSIPEAIEFPTEGGLTSYGFFYPPKNHDFVAPQGEKPPLLVMSHGGPTSSVSATFSPNILYWTSRGIGVLDVNYGGSTGYGRDYRERLNGQWGVVDVDDCVNGALYLVKRGDADGDRLIIRGGSAGGYTTLNALTFRDVFKAGASYYGVSDLEAMVQDTHKFESRYLDSMIGPYPERKDLYIERSSVHSVDRLSTPIIFFQGLEDKVVPPNQAEMMVDALRRKGLPVAYVPFEGEQHGFRKAENIKRSLDNELYFYSRVLGFKLAGHIEPLEIENLA
ncbi:MAG: S9 family peptidase [Chloroflexota bacterium]|nr:S9 family peptidase [Chloroflexota bacterium]